MNTDIEMRAREAIKARFKSGNSVPVERVHITRTEFAALSQQPSVAAGVPEGMLDRIKAAEQRLVDGHALRRIPADPTDLDLVLAEVRAWIEGDPSPFWTHPGSRG